MIVVDASVLASALVDDGDDGVRTRLRLTAENLLFAPEIIDLEIASVLRRGLRLNSFDAGRSWQALTDLADLPLVRFSHHLFMDRIWELRHNLTPYDAAYVALAEALGVTLLTVDGRSTRAPALRCAVELLQ